ncbi:trehalose-phosphatase [Halostagnicola kamekurae]|uniref:Trehalose 6-phosphate phosphatase n=1 Tax=Halostagnicola kamekurae TaxID=619731 RepID=A0A1I6U506_9EURY|nr:trehalose-phosphatase [Halostagnicola kamekurae]SFS96484.1 trehalose 6-phosphate phosphatase [Halostagnicola kamekurae]
MSKDSPIPVDEQLPRIRSALRETDSVLLCLDFDGTMAPIVDDPSEATPLTTAVDAVQSLASNPTVRTAVVSGRSLADVRSRLDGPSLFAGNHGLEIQRRGSVSVHPIARKRSTLVDRSCIELSDAFDSFDDCWVENKRLTATVHRRSNSPDRRETIRRVTKSVLDRVGEGRLTYSRGRRILEISPRIPWGKGNAVEVLRRSVPADSLVVYLGDDTTDELAFEAVEPEGIGILVGEPAPSRASARLDSPAAVASFLHWLESDALARSKRSQMNAVGRPSQRTVQ